MVMHLFQLKLPIFFLFFISFFYSFIFSHGFHKDTIIRCNNDNYIKTIGQMAKDAEKKFFHTIISYHTKKGTWVEKNIQASSMSTIPFYCELSFNEPESSSPSTFFTVTCSPKQNFYRIPDNQWVPACQLQQGDLLLAEHNKHIRLDNSIVIQKSIDMYSIEIKNTHVFLVTTHGLVAHNYAIPWALLTALGLPGECAAGGSLGSFFGPVGVCAGVVAGGIAGLAINSYTENTTSEPSTEKNTKKEEKAPGKPTENDGFIPKKNNNDKKVRHTDSGKYGWIDKRESIWIPSGPKGQGGPHWIVRHTNGGYDKVFPGGKIIEQLPYTKNNNMMKKMMKKIFWDNPYQSELDTKIIEVNGDELLFAETIIYSFAGGQESDAATINNIPVLHSRKEGHLIYYTVPENHNLSVGDDVHMKIDWPRRLKLMRLHFAAEIILEIVNQKFGYEKIGAHISEKKSRIDFISDNNIKLLFPEIITEYNRIIEQNLVIEKGYLDIETQRRYWKIDGFAQVPCGGTHCNRTGEIGFVALKRDKPGKSIERIEITLLTP